MPAAGKIEMNEGYCTTELAWEKAQQQIRDICTIFRPPPRLSVAEWAEEHRFLSSETAAEPGKWRNRRTPYLIEPMEALSPKSGIEEVVLMFSSQTGKSEIVLNFLGFIMHLDPGPVLIVQPNERMMKTFSTKRVQPLIRDCPVLTPLVPSTRSRTPGNTQEEKVFPGGYLSLTSSNSAAGLASRPIRYALFDEIGRYEATAEGDSVALGTKRTVSFHNRVVLKVSSPNREETDIHAAYLRSDQRRYWVPCPHCGGLQVLKWSQIKFERANPLDAWYECEHCEEPIEHRQKRWMLDPRNGATWVADEPENGYGKVRGFWLNQLYSPFRTWGETVTEFLEAKDDAEKLKTFVNTALSEPWREESESVDWTDLKERREYYGPELPAGVLQLCLGVDVQADRLEGVLYGFGLRNEVWFIQRKIWFGSPTKQAVWRELEEYRVSNFEHERYGRLPISAVAIDTGGQHTAEVYAYCKTRYDDYVFATKGGNISSMPIAPKRPNRKNKGKVPLFVLGVDTAKSHIYSALRNDDPESINFWHFCMEADDDFFEQLTAEKRVRRYRKGFEVLTWEKRPGVRNEVLDCTVYALAAYHLRNADLQRLKTELENRISEFEYTGEPVPAQPTPTRRRGRRQISGGLSA